ncbi:phosphoribosylamine--glycine ligase [Candidatus Cyanaurora vandensis]|uniref:phosphoribosylamine--glycine ligase n=1 Tax=Candidatus Cyanaurora vandensis TaxID=2714958 RepID=UPI0025806B57|nr:phosphoribosylamine--glycine ligase [Candidatus Cyanaurora vandensis]
MKVLVLGGGGREHCLAWKLSQSPLVETIFCVPGNGGTATVPKVVNIALDPLDFPALVQLVQVQGIDWGIVGPEVPLAAGVVDYFQARGLALIGPTQQGAQIESSKAWAKDLMAEAGVPTAKAGVFRELAPALAYLKQAIWPLVVKADGLAQGKGVTIAPNYAEAAQALTACFAGGQTQVVLEDFLVGEEVSVLALTDGRVVVPLLAAQDHKTIGEGDTGPNTGGMGAYAPLDWLTPATLVKIQKLILEPTLRGLQARGITYRGILYAGLMIDAAGEPAVVEFNCRLGDPETQAVLPLLQTDFAHVCKAILDGTLDQLILTWANGYAATVVVTAAGYPGVYAKGDPITGLDQGPGLIFHAGTAGDASSWTTQGGRVLAVTGLAKSLRAALDVCHQTIARVHFPGMYYRRDIGFKALDRT